MSALTDIEHGMAVVARRVCPTFRPTGPASFTATSALRPGVVDDLAVLVKRPVDLRPFWLARARHEIAVYQVIREQPPDLPVPRLVASDPAEPLLIITNAGDNPLHPDRYVNRPVPATMMAATLGILDRLHRWSPTGVPHDNDYPGQLAAIHHVLLDAPERESLARLHTLAAAPVQVEHGDAHLGNVLEPVTSPVLIDFEFTAWRPAGYDLAKLWVYLSSNDNRRQVLDHVGDDPRPRASFWIAAILALSREIASYQRDPSQPGGPALAERLHADLRHARRHAQTLVDVLDGRPMRHTFTS